MKDAKKTFQQKQRNWQANLDSLNIKYQKELKVDKGRAQVLNLNLKKYNSQIEQLSQQEDERMTSAVLDQINTFTEIYGEKHGYDYILGTTSEGNILYGKKSLDITEEMLEALNHYYATGEVK